jgi:hypothetical protein
MKQKLLKGNEKVIKGYVGGRVISLDSFLNCNCFCRLPQFIFVILSLQRDWAKNFFNII